jgi:hypothetical protein
MRSCNQTDTGDKRRKLYENDQKDLVSKEENTCNGRVNSIEK